MTINLIKARRIAKQNEENAKRELAILNSKQRAMQQFVEVADRISKNGPTW